MLNRMGLIATCLLVSSVAVAGKAKKYSIADLKALVESKSYPEAAEHLADIAPSERKAEWQDLAGQTAVGLVGTGKDGMEKLGYMVAFEQQYPAVLKSAAYVKMRADEGPKGFEACFGNQYGVEECFNYAVKFVDADAKNGKLALDIAKIARRGMHSANAIPLFKRAYAAKAPVCADEDLQEAVNSAFDRYDTDLAKDARVLATSCWNDVRKVVLKDIANNNDEYRKNVCEIAKAKKDPDTAKACAK